MSSFGERYSKALKRVVDILGDSSDTLSAFNQAISARYPRRDLIVKQAEQFADLVEREAFLLTESGGRIVTESGYPLELEACIDNGVNYCSCRHCNPPRPYLESGSLPF